MLVSWSLTSLFSTNMAISETNLYHVEVTLMRISCRGLPTHQIRLKLEKLFVDGSTYAKYPHSEKFEVTYGRTDGRTDTCDFSKSISSSRRNRALTSCRLGPVISTISFEVHHSKMAEEIDIEKCNFWQFSEVQKLRDCHLDLGLGQGHISMHQHATSMLPAHPSV